jgi:hypothetical protein
MSAAAKGLFGLAVFLALLGIVLGQEGVGRMQRKGLPPFNEGLWTAVWPLPQAPAALVKWSATAPGKVTQWSLLVFVPALGIFLSRWASFSLVPLLLVMIWSVLQFGWGLWIWLNAALV